MLRIFFSGNITKRVGTLFINSIIVGLENKEIRRESMFVNFFYKPFCKKYFVL